MTQTSFGLYFFNQFLKRQVLMTVSRQRGFLHFPQQFAKSHFGGHGCAYHQRVHEEPDERLSLFASAIGNGRSNHNFILPRVAPQQSLKRRQQRHEQSCPFLSREILERSVQIRSHSKRFESASERLHWWPRPIQRQVQHGRSFGQLLLPV